MFKNLADNYFKLFMKILVKGQVNKNQYKSYFIYLFTFKKERAIILLFMKIFNVALFAGKQEYKFSVVQVNVRSYIT